MQKAHDPGPIGPGAAVRWSTSGRYYGEVWMMPEGGPCEPGTLMGVGPGLRGLLRISLLGTSVNKPCP